MRPSVHALASLCAVALAAAAPSLHAADLPEYKLKAAFLYNFAVFTEWPAETGPTLHLCVVGKDPFGEDLEALQGKPVGERRLAITRTSPTDALGGCQIVFIAPSSIANLPALLARLKGAVTLTVADSPGAAAQGVALNMNLSNAKVTFEANLGAARSAHLNLSSKLLRLATEVHQ